MDRRSLLTAVASVIMCSRTAPCLAGDVSFLPFKSTFRLVLYHIFRCLQNSHASCCAFTGEELVPFEDDRDKFKVSVPQGE